MKTERFEMRLDPRTLGRVDSWRSEQVDLPSRAEAMRRLVDLGLGNFRNDEVRLSDGEKLILMELQRLQTAVSVGLENDAGFTLDAIDGGHYWAFKWQYPGLFHDHSDRPEVVSEVTSILEMWTQIEWGYEELGENDRRRIEVEAEPFGNQVRFEGFDGNEETSYLNITRFLIKKLGRFKWFKERDLNTHWPVLPAYRRMLRVYEPMKLLLHGGRLGVDPIVALLREQTHPSRSPNTPEAEASSNISSRDV